MTTFPEALAAELGHYIPGATPEDWEREAAAILARMTPTDPRAEVEADLCRRADAASEYAEAILAYLNPENQYTHSRQHAMDEAERVLRLAVLDRPAPPSDDDDGAGIDPNGEDFEGLWNGRAALPPADPSAE
jgi:hypothetical protein